MPVSPPFSVFSDTVCQPFDPAHRRPPPVARPKSIPACILRRQSLLTIRSRPHIRVILHVLVIGVADTTRRALVVIIQFILILVTFRPRTLRASTLRCPSRLARRILPCIGIIFHVLVIATAAARTPLVVLIQLILVILIKVVVTIKLVVVLSQAANATSRSIARGA